MHKVVIANDNISRFGDLEDNFIYITLGNRYEVLWETRRSYLIRCEYDDVPRYFNKYNFNIPSNHRDKVINEILK